MKSGFGTTLEIVVLVALTFWGCIPSKPRPSNVPSDATLIPASKGAGVWQHCTMNPQATVQCKIFNRNGLILYDDVFTVYSGKSPISPADLRIASKGPEVGEQWVRLENGTILIPQSDVAEMTRALDWLFGKRATR